MVAHNAHANRRGRSGAKPSGLAQRPPRRCDQRVAPLRATLPAQAFDHIVSYYATVERDHILLMSGDQPGKVMNVLLVGSDSRANTTGDLADSTGKIAEGGRQ